MREIKKEYRILCITLLFPFFTCLISGCVRDGEKTGNLTMLYAVFVLLAVLLMLAYCLAVKKKQGWFVVLFASIIVVNTGYLALALSESLEAALWANRVSYMGSVCLPLAMFMIIMKVCEVSYKRWMVVVLTIISIVVFCVAGSPGYSDIYYREVTFENVHGMGTLQKVYGAWHDLYLVYLLGYFGSMVGTILYSGLKKTAESQWYATILGGAVFVNIGVWLMEQFVDIEFEILSVSYIITEFFLLALCILMQENERIKTLSASAEKEIPQDVVQDVAEKAQEVIADQEEVAKRRFFEEHLYLLTKTERRVYDYYMADMSTKEILKEMDITENTLKYHNRNIYGKLGVSSRKQLKEIGRQL